jgi:hypothetical protein
MNQVKPKNATTIAGLLDERSEGIAARYDFRSYRCALHIGATLVRPRTVRSQWQGILCESRAPKLSAFPLPVRCNPSFKRTGSRSFRASQRTQLFHSSQ